MSINPQDIKIVKVISVSDPLFSEICELLEESFIPDERREFNEDLLSKINFNLMAAIYKDELIGFRTMWTFNDFIFNEHAAVKAHLRGQGMGSILYKKTFDLYPGMLFVSEVERPDTEIASRRIEYNKRLGCHLNFYDYIQPPYGKGKSPLPMYINSYPRPITDDEYTNIKNTLYKNVYNYLG